jgi:hypothetical protein
MTTFSIAITYLATYTNPKFLFPWLYLSFLLVFYCFSRRFVNATSAVVFTLLIIVTPELSAFSVFVKTNVIQTAMASGGMLALLVWYRHRELRYFYVSALLLGLNAWTRSEGIEFIGVAMLLLLWVTFKRKSLSWNKLGTYALISMLPFVLWQVYLSHTPDLSAYAAVSIIKTPFWDAQRLGYILKALYQHAFHQQYFGMLFYLLGVAVAVQLIFARMKLHHYIHIGVLLALVGAHVVLLYQFAYSSDKEMLNLLNHSLKRYIFNWIPLSSFVIADSIAVRWIFDQLERFTSAGKLS